MITTRTYLSSATPALAILANLFTPLAMADSFEPGSLTVSEGFSNPLGFYDAQPTFSWKLPPGIATQSAYQIIVRDESTGKIIWDSGKTLSDQSVWIPFAAGPLESRQNLAWKVKSWDDTDVESRWSAESTIEMGLLSNKDWSAKWIAAQPVKPPFDWTKVKILKADYGGKDVSEILSTAIARQKLPLKINNETMGGDPSPKTPKLLTLSYEYSGEQNSSEIKEGESFGPDGVSDLPAHPGYVFRKEFSTEKKLTKARLYASALGIYEFRINGKPVGTDLMAPGWTSYENRIETRTYDVTEMLSTGKNAIGALLGEGWYAGTLFRRNISTLGGRMPKLLGQLELTFDDGSTRTISTDASWKSSSEGPITASGYYFGEEYDARRELGNWSETGYDDSTWKKSIASTPDPKPLLEPKPMAPVRITEERPAVSVKEQEPGVFIFDFGQNLVGFPELTIPVAKGRKINIRVAEMLNKDGSLYTENYREARALAHYIPAVDGTITWQPALTFFGFRYVELSGLPEGTVLEKDAVTAKVIHTDFPSSGTFTSSHEKLNQLQSNIRWGQIGNFVDVPTDCPQRDERLGWTGDAQVILPSSFFNYDLYAFWSRWLKIARDDQKPNGEIPFFIPKAGIALDGSCPGWGDAIVTIPWEIYERTGDKRILEENFAAMKKWLGVYERSAKGNISGLKGFGDWLQPYAKNQRGDTPFEVIATAYYGRCARILSWTAAALGKNEEAARFTQIHADIRKAFSEKFIGEDGKMTDSDTQTAYLMALGYDLVVQPLREKTAAALVTSFENADRHLRTGFLGTPLLAPVFDEIGHPEISYELLFKESYPGWFYSINQGATTMWERWNSFSHEDGFGDAGMNSFNHYAYGAIGQWMYERVAGLTPDAAHPGYKHFFIRPLPGGPLTSASAELETPYGLAKSAWKLDGKIMSGEVIVPPNTTATLEYPGNAKPPMELAPGTHEFSVELP